MRVPAQGGARERHQATPERTARSRERRPVSSVLGFVVTRRLRTTDTTEPLHSFMQGTRVLVADATSDAGRQHAPPFERCVAA